MLDIKTLRNSYMKILVTISIKINIAIANKISSNSINNCEQKNTQ